MTKRMYRKQSWNDWYACAQAYYEAHSNLLVPAKYQTPDGFRLGRWIERQRAIHNGIIAGQLSESQIKALDQIGMVWKLEDRLEWHIWMNLVQKYHDQYGNLDIHTDYISDGYRLGFWIKEQRKKYKNGLLNDSQISDLNRLGMIWCFYEKKEWNDWYQLAEAYYQEHGDLLVPVAYCTNEGDKLGSWIFVQREKYNGIGKRLPLSQDQIRALEKIGMVWTLAELRDDKWTAMYQYVALYKREHGKLPLSSTIKAPDGRSMGNWISMQRVALRKNRMPEDKANKLADLEIYPFGHASHKTETDEVLSQPALGAG